MYVLASVVRVPEKLAKAVESWSTSQPRRSRKDEKPRRRGARGGECYSVIVT